jgi:hypothetical protein
LTNTLVLEWLTNKLVAVEVTVWTVSKSQTRQAVGCSSRVSRVSARLVRPTRFKLLSIL